MKFEKTQLVQILGCSQATEDKWITAINAACAKFGIDTKLRLAAFIAQVGHESGRLSTVTENLNYSASGLMGTWPSRFDSFKANACARNPEKIANVVYSSRMGNGPEASGDGWKYRGRGLIQCTGKVNYDAFSQACGVNAVQNPDSLTSPDNAALSAGWFWNSKGLNAYADRGDFLTITKRINGGTNGQAEREMLYKKAIIVLSGGQLPTDTELAKKAVEASPTTTSQVSEQKTPGAQNSSIVEPRSVNGGASKSEYPWNQVTESRSGHIIEIDDTPGYERLNMTHRTGSYWEFDPLGTFTIKSVLDSYKLTKGDAYDYTGGNYTQQIKGQSFRQSSGDTIFKSGGQFFVNANRVQMNTGMMAVSGEINAPSINSNLFGGMGGLAFGDLLAKQALVAYDIVKGKAPMLGQSLGFKGLTGDGSADGAMTNKLAYQSPNGTPWVTNGIGTALVAGVAAGAAAAVVADLLKTQDKGTQVSNALTSAASDISAKELAERSQTPVFLKHVSFDKPTLLSQSDLISLPDPSLYVNNLHTIVAPDGVGRLHMSNGEEWVEVGSSEAVIGAQITAALDTAIAYSEGKTAQQISDEALARAQAITQEAIARSQALVAEAQARQQEIAQGILAEATERGASIQAESILRQSAEESLSDRILTLTASTADNIAAAVQQEQQARADAISAEASVRELLAARVDDAQSSISDEAITRATQNSTTNDRITTYISSNDSALAAQKTEIKTYVDDTGTAISSRIDALVSTTQGDKSDLTAMINTEQQTRTDSVSALSTRVDTLIAENGAGAAALVQSETNARVNADGALSGRIDTVVASVNDNLALFNQEVQARSDAVSSAVGQITVLRSDTNILVTDTQNALQLKIDAKSKITRATTAPATPTVGDIWIDTSTTQNIGKVWSGSAWQEFDYRIAKNSADIVNEIQARTDADSANASSISTLSARVNNGNAAPFEPYMAWDFNAGNEGWTSGGMNLTFTAGNMNLDATTSDPVIYSPAVSVNGAVYNKVRAKVKRIAGSSWQGQLYYSTGGHGVSEAYTKVIAPPPALDFTDWYILEWDMSNLTAGGADWTSNTITSLRLDLGNSAADRFVIDWISIGKQGVGVPTSNFATVSQTTSANADAIGNVKAQWGIKTNVNGKVAGIALVNDLINGAASSSFTVQADKFAIETPAGDRSPFGVDASGVYINGTVRINTSGGTLADYAANAAVPAVSFIGSFASAPAGTKNNVYLNTSDGNSYIHNGSGWVIYLLKGSTGSPGTNGTNGAQGPQGNPGANGTNGTNGTNGAPGARGSMTFYASGSSWSDTTANNAVTTITGSSQRIIGDTVTISAGNFAGTKYWSGTGWVDPGVKIDGNLLVSKTISAAALNVTQLSVITPTIGTLRQRVDNGGGGVEISDDQVRVYDGANKLRIKLGYLF